MPQDITIITADPQLKKLVNDSLANLDINVAYHDDINKLTTPSKSMFILYDSRLGIKNPVAKIQQHTKRSSPIITIYANISEPIRNAALEIEGTLTESSIRTIFKRFWKNTHGMQKEKLINLSKNDLNIPLWLTINNFKLISLPILMYNLQATEIFAKPLNWSELAPIINTKVFAENDSAQYDEWLEIINNTEPEHINPVWEILLNSSLCKDHRINAGINELLDAACERGLNLTNIKTPSDTAPYAKSLIAIQSLISGDNSKLIQLLEDEQRYIEQNHGKLSELHEQKFWYGIYHSIIQYKNKDKNLAEHFKQFFLNKYKTCNVETKPWAFMKNLNFQYTDQDHNICIDLLQKYSTDVQNLPRSLITWCASDNCIIEHKKHLLQTTGFTIIPYKMRNEISKIFKDIATPDTKELRFNFYKAHIYSEESLDFSSELLHMCFPEYQTKFKSLSTLASELITTQEEYLSMLRYSILIDDIKSEELPEFTDIFNPN